MLKDEGYKLMGAAFEVYNQLGYGVAAEVYQQSLEIELELPPVSRSRPSASWTCSTSTGSCKPVTNQTWFVFGAIVVELKAVSRTDFRPRGPTVQLHADFASTGWLPDQLRPQRRVAMEAVHPVRPAPAGNGDSDGEH